MMKKKLLAYIKSLNIKALLILVALSVLCAIINNLRAPADKAVAWWGSQEILEKPKDF